MKQTIAKDVKDTIKRNERLNPNFYKDPTRAEIVQNFQSNFEDWPATRTVKNADLAKTLVDRGICLVCGFKYLPHLHRDKDGDQALIK